MLFIHSYSIENAEYNIPFYNEVIRCLRDSWRGFKLWIHDFPVAGIEFQFKRWYFIILRHIE